jgi:hypothetical protein
VIILASFVAMLVLIWAWGRYTKQAVKYLKNSEVIWDRLFVAARRVIEDPDMPREAAGFAVAAALCSGCGCLSVQIVADRLASAIGRDRFSDTGSSFTRKLDHEQRVTFGRMVALAIFYDTMRAPITGFIVRRLILPWLSSVANGDAAPPMLHGVGEATVSARRAIEARPEGKRALALTA